jgi:hypothetical protein
MLIVMKGLDIWLRLSGARTAAQSAEMSDADVIRVATRANTEPWTLSILTIKHRFRISSFHRLSSTDDAGAALVQVTLVGRISATTASRPALRPADSVAIEIGSCWFLYAEMEN